MNYSGDKDGLFLDTSGCVCVCVCRGCSSVVLLM